MKKRIQASKFQELFWKTWQVHPEESSLVLPYLYRLKGCIDVSRLQKSILQYIMECHPACQSFFQMEEQGLFQVFEQSSQFPIKQFDCIKENQVDINAIWEELSKPFDLKASPLVRFIFAPTGEHEFLFGFAFSHIIFDGLSLDRFVDAISKNYNSINHPQDISKKFLELGSVYESSDEEAKSFWKKELAGSSLANPIFFQHSNRRSEEKKLTDALSIQGELKSQVSAFVHESGTTAFRLITGVQLALLGLFCEKVGGKKELLFGHTVSTSKDALYPGCNVNLIPLRLSFDSLWRPIDYINEVSCARKRVRSFQKYPFLDLIMNVPSLTKEQGYFDFIVNESQGIISPTLSFDFEGLESVEVLRKPSVDGRYALGLHYGSLPDSFEILFGYDPTLCSKKWIQRYAFYYQELLRFFVCNPKIPIKDWELYNQLAIFLNPSLSDRGQDQNKEDEALRYWKQELLGVSNIKFPFKGGGESLNRVAKTNYLRSFSKDTYLRVKELVKKEGVTEYSFWAALFLGTLRKYVNQEDIITGIHVGHLNDDISEHRNVMKIFPLRVPFHGSTPFKDQLKQVNRKIKEGKKRGEVSLEQLIDYLDISRDSNRHPIFQTIFSAGYDEAPTDGLGEVDLVLRAKADKDEMQLLFEFDQDSFEKSDIENFANSLVSYLDLVLENSSVSIGNINILSNTECQRFEEWNKTQYPVLCDKSISQKFGDIVSNNKDKVALIYQDRQVSYQFLNERSSQLAAVLVSKGVKPDCLVGLSVPKGVDLIVGMLGILKSAGAYLPLDPEYPKNRLDYVINDSQVNILVTVKSLIGQFSNFCGHIICIDDLEYHNFEQESVSQLMPMSLAYVIYTSGSTGNPKGVGIQEKSLLYLIEAQKKIFSISDKTRGLQFASSSFDASVWETFVILLVGGTLVISDESFRNRLFYNLNREQVNFATLSPAVLINALTFEQKVRYQGVLVSAGEALILDDLENSFDLINAYGPTESTVCATAGKNIKEIHIGTPIPNNQIYLLDSDFNQVPLGSCGEIFIGGNGLARGYLNRPGLTAEKFLPNPFLGEGERLYRTGDLARYSLDGNIKFVGRVDDQIKLRGFRIELGEIEATISKLTEVDQVAVIIREDQPGKKQLVAYVVINQESQVDFPEEMIRKACADQLPEYMQPNLIMFLDVMPLTTNHKIDRKNLPEPQHRKEIGEDDQPKGREEETLARIWKRLLHLETIGRNDNFFHLGGDSIISIQMVSLAKAEGIHFDVNQIFKFPTIAELIANKRDIQEILQPSQEKASGRVRLTPIQRLFFENPVEISHYNQAQWIVSDQPIDPKKLGQTLRDIHDSHDAFSLRFRKEGEKWIQYYDETPNFLFEVISESISDEEVDIFVNRIQESLNIEKGPISRAIWVNGRGLFWVIHHLIVDGVSWRILLDDLNHIYQGQSLPLKSHNFKDWSDFLYRYELLSDVINFYKGFDRREIPYDRNASNQLVAGCFETSLSKDLTCNFLTSANKSYNTQPDDLLLAALGCAISEHYFLDEVVINLEGHGREDLGGNLDLTRTIGWFTALHPVRLEIPADKDLSSCIKGVKEQLRKIPQKGVSYGIACLQGKLSKINPSVLFNYLGQFGLSCAPDDVFRFGNLPIGSLISEKREQIHPLEINSIVIDEKLHFNWSYTHSFCESTIQSISRKFEKFLTQIINHCCNKDTPCLTPSDITAKNVSQEELDFLFE